MPKKSVKRSKPGGNQANKGPAAKGKGAKGKGAKGQGGRPNKKGAKGPPKKRVFRKKPASPGSSAGPARPRQEGERLQKVLAAAGIASRRECEELILEGRVQVDGQVVTELGARVDPTKQTVKLDGEELTSPKLVYFAVNKPTGVVCTARDPSGRPRVTDLLPPSVGRVFAVGRLDMASEGLILVTNDGELANRLTHPRHGVEKLYHVQVAGTPTPEVLREVRRGVYLDEGRVAFANVKVKSTKKSSAILEVILDEGRNREIRRVLARVGHKVQKLQRIAVGPVRLAEMPAGAYRELTRDEVTALREATQGKHKRVAEDKRTAGPRPNRKRPPHKSAPKRKQKAERPKTSERLVIGADDAATATEKPKRAPKHRPHKHGHTGKPAVQKSAQKSAQKPAKQGGKKTAKKPGKPAANKQRGGKPKGKR